MFRDDEQENTGLRTCIEGSDVLLTLFAGMAKLVDARDLKSLGFNRVGSTPTTRTKRDRSSMVRAVDS